MSALAQLRGALLAGRNLAATASLATAQRSISVLRPSRAAAAVAEAEASTEEDELPEEKNLIWITKLNDSPLPERVGLRELSSHVFGQPLRTDILHRVVVYQRAGWREGNAKVKNRAEVRGSGRKIRPQKGSGKSRCSSIRAPLFRGGGVVHGPVPRDFSISLPKKVRDLGLRVALSVKAAQGDLHVVDSYNIDTHKTKFMQRVFDARGWKSAVILTPSVSPVNLALSASNLPEVDVQKQENVNVYDLLKRECVIVTPEVLDYLEKRFARPLSHSLARSRARAAAAREGEAAGEAEAAEESVCKEYWSEEKKVEKVDLKDAKDITSSN